MKPSRRAASTGAALLVAAIAAYASYSHMRHLALAYGQDQAVATLLPVSVDGMLVVATVALGDGRRRRWSAWLAFWTGVTASVIANILAAEPSAIARCISAWPAVAFLLVVEVITRGARAGTLRVPVPGVFDAVEVHGETRPADRPRRRTGGRPSAATKVARAAARMPDAPVDKIAAKTGLSQRTVRRHLAALTVDASPDKTPNTQPVNGAPVPDFIDAN